MSSPPSWLANFSSRISGGFSDAQAVKTIWPIGNQITIAIVDV
jgi:hypothetical protein